MDYPILEKDLHIVVIKPFSLVYINEFLIKYLKDTIIEIEVNELENNESLNSAWISKFSLLNLFISDTLIEKYDNNTFKIEEYEEWLKSFIDPFVQINRSINGSENRKRPYTSLSAFYKSSDDFIFHFIFGIDGDYKDYINAGIQVFETIKLYNLAGDNELKVAVKESYSQKDNIKYFLYSDGSWNAINLLVEVGKELNTKYRNGRDWRIKKPLVMMDKNNYQKSLIFDDNWVLKFDRYDALMVKPNDVSLYTNITDQNLQKANEIYKEEILPKYKFLTSTTPLNKEQTIYYDYFEYIISAVIFAYTAIEAFTNICIPNNYEYITNEQGVKTIYNKEAIERKFPLREKLKIHLKEILVTSNPTQESWWGNFISLEEIRNEIIHTKQSKSEERYSKLLSKSIFQYVESHKAVIKFYGEFVKANYKDLLSEIPYNLGYDDLFPSMISEENFQEIYNEIINKKSF